MTVSQSGLPAGCAVRYSPGSRANRAGASPDAARGAGTGVFSVALSSMAAILDDRDDIQVQGTSAGGVHGVRAVAFDQPQQPVHLTHPRPRQVVIQQPLGVDADVGSVPGGRGDQPGQVAHGVAGLLRRQIDWVGAARTGWLSWVGLDQLPAVEHLHQLTVRAGRNPSAPDNCSGTEYSALPTWTW